MVFQPDVRKPKIVDLGAGVRYHSSGSMAQKEKKPLPPRSKRMNRKQRLQAAPRWLSEYKGSHVVRSYRKRYGVDWLCAVTELRFLGAEIDSDYISKLQWTVQEQAKKNYEKRLELQKAAADKEWSERYPFSEGDFYFVAGHSSNGVPYGITWEEAQRQGLIEDDAADTTKPDIDTS